MDLTSRPASLSRRDPDRWLVVAAAMAACLVPTLMAFNLAPSATFLNQAAALIGWGMFLLTIRLLAPAPVPRRGGVGVLAAALLLLAAAAAASWAWAALPSGLALSSIGMVAAALLTVLVAAAATRAGHAELAFHALCVALVAAGVLSVIVSVVQVYVPDAAGGEWIAATALEGRATGNLRQPNHLSSLLLWSFIAAVWLAEAGFLRRDLAAVLGAALVFGLVLSASRTGIVGVVVLALWGLLDRRLSGPGRRLLIAAPLAYVAFWAGLAGWAHLHQQTFAGEARITADGDISSS
ncbi:MAG TPA: pilin glycosylation ligase domain-containing protein, partial [Albitalea sp.]|nr:pilin glycosylation ligase domain-containing protein [Albitalea sp.]